MFCIKDMPTACSPMGGLNAHTRKKTSKRPNTFAIALKWFACDISHTVFDLW